MKHTLLNKYIAGQTNAEEEHRLMRLLQEAPKLTSEEAAALQLLQFGNDEKDEEDIFAVDYSEEYNKVIRTRKIIRMWPLAAAACVAAILIVFLTPPKEDAAPATSQALIAQVEQEPADEQAEVIAPNPQSVRHNHLEAKRAAVSQGSKPAKHNNTKTCHQQPSVDDPYEFIDTYSDPEIAKAEAEIALQLLADNLNKGIEMLENATNT